jgi:hypothetical protein
MVALVCGVVAYYVSIGVLFQINASFGGNYQNGVFGEAFTLYAPVAPALLAVAVCLGAVRWIKTRRTRRCSRPGS